MTARTSMAAVALLAGMMIPAAAQTGQKTFATPQDAAKALIDAAAGNDTAAMLLIFGPGGKDIVQSGDAAADKESRERFAALARQKMQVELDEDKDRATLVVGPDDWPMPVPVVLEKGQWRFNAAVGRVEVLARRVGRNELTAMDVCRAYVEAQVEYASRDRTATGILQYAQKILSSPGKKDGLYWESEPDNLVPKAFADASSEAWYVQKWRDKLAAGFTVSGGPRYDGFSPPKSRTILSSTTPGSIIQIFSVCFPGFATAASDAPVTAARSTFASHRPASSRFTTAGEESSMAAA